MACIFLPAWKKESVSEPCNDGGLGDMRLISEERYRKIGD